MAELKAHPSNWIKTKMILLKNSIGRMDMVFSLVNPYEVMLYNLILKNQHVHHQKKIFQDEYRTFLKRHELEFDER